MRKQSLRSHHCCSSMVLVMAHGALRYVTCLATVFLYVPSLQACLFSLIKSKHYRVCMCAYEVKASFCIPACILCMQGSIGHFPFEPSSPTALPRLRHLLFLCQLPFSCQAGCIYRQLSCCSVALQENFLPWFAQHGHHCFAVSFRGHGTSSDQSACPDTYAQSNDDLAHVIASLPRPPVLIALSMGGFFGQRWVVHTHIMHTDQS